MTIHGVGNSNSILINKERSSSVDKNLEFKRTELPGSNKVHEGSFLESLHQAVDKVNTMQKDADNKVESLMTGRSNNIHETMVSMEKADIALKLMVQVRNKIIDAYQEIMKMQV